jgi:acyl carrier protein
MTDRRQEVYEAIKGHLVGRGLEENRITPQAQLLGDLDLDSLDTMELTLSLEQKFTIEIPDEELQDLETVEDAVQLIERKLPVTA